MNLKHKLYIGYIIVFVFLYSQVFFPFSARVSNINVVEADSSESLPVFNMLAASGEDAGNIQKFIINNDAVLKDAGNYHFLEYDVSFESTSLLPVKIVGVRLSVDDRYKDRVILLLAEPYDRTVSTFGKTGSRMKLLVDTGSLPEAKIREMVKGISIHISWKPLVGPERENRVYLPQDTLSLLK